LRCCAEPSTSVPAQQCILTHCLFIIQAEDGIRDRNVTGVQTCALPISPCVVGSSPTGGTLKTHSSQHVFRAFPQCLYGLISDNRRSPQLLSAQESGHRDEKRPPDSRHHRGLSCRGLLQSPLHCG